ncbi:FAD-dependent oxidoreductase [Bacillus massiliigorillae]|uniref:FAD-dependent oxidoreductase n=1 Tax=Bacillus massiliigorillae TaxID=1243664 RepID=UPI00039ADAB6|nr:FAD-dependent oxidoreductase [Bacillus massiliigorillae]
MPAKKPASWDYETDVVVLGTGGAALVSAILAHDNGANVIILEKANQIGGTTAFSGGVPWIPMNRYMKEKGIEDSREQALTYLQRLTGGKVPNPALLETFVDHAHKMIDYLHENTPLRFAIPKDFTEYYTQIPGTTKGGRSLDPMPFSLNELGEWADKLRNNPVFPPLTLEEGGAVGGIDYMKIAERMENNIVTMGRSLIASLFKACLDRGIQAFTETPGKELVMNDNGEVIGVRAEQSGQNLFVGARKGVILASGGFEWNQELVKTFLKGHVTHPLSPKGNTGDGLIMAMEAGAALGNMSEAWWYPAMQDPTIEYEDDILTIIGNGRGGKNSIIVNKNAKRFVNEGTSYMDMPKAFYEYDPVKLEWPNEPPVWMIFDSQLKNSTMVVTVLPEDPAPDWMNQADTLRDLAIQLDLDPNQLEATVQQFNEYARNGVDPDFGRGTSNFEDFSTNNGGVEANLGPIEQGPFYAIPIYYGTLGTNGGPRINENGQVISLRGKTIPGLYAAGNAAMGVFGATYPSAGGTIGPAMTFGYLAGIAIGQEEARSILS